MKHCISTIFVIALIAFLTLSGCSKSNEPEAPLKNRVYFPDKIEATGGDHFAVPIYFENEIPVEAVNVPLLFPSSVMRVDSVSFVSSRVNNFEFQRVSSPPDTIVIGAISTGALVSPGRGLFATIYFWAHGNAPDTTFDLGTFDYWRLPLAYSDTSLNSLILLPQAKPCRVHISTQLPSDSGGAPY